MSGDKEQSEKVGVSMPQKCEITDTNMSSSMQNVSFSEGDIDDDNPNRPQQDGPTNNNNDPPDSGIAEGSGGRNMERRSDLNVNDELLSPRRSTDIPGTRRRSKLLGRRRPSPMQIPGPGPDIPVDGAGNVPIVARRREVDINAYQHKKTLASGMMDLALFSANASQLRYVREVGGNHPYYYSSLAMLAISIFLQLVVGIALIVNGRYNIKDEDDMRKADIVNNFTIIAVFLIITINVFISVFGCAELPDLQK